MRPAWATAPLVRGAPRLAIGLAVAVAACAAPVAPTEDPMTAWQRTPLAPDATLEAAARASLACQAEQQGEMQIVLQDRRTTSTAAFLTAWPGSSGSCLLSLTGGGGGSAHAAPAAPLRGQIVVDEQATGGAGGETATLLGGRIAPNVADVQVELSVGGVVSATVGNGHWLAWWPGGLQVLRIVAFDAAGGELAAIEDPTPEDHKK